MKRRILLTAVAIAGSVGLSVAARAAPVYTSIVGSAEPLRIDIFENSGIGDTSWTAVGLNYDDGAGVVATRMADARDDTGSRAPGTTMNINGSVSATDTDQAWVDGVATASAEAKWAGYHQGFGLFSGGSVANKITVLPNGFNPVQTNIENPFATGPSFKWGRAGDEDDFTSLPWSSLETDNTGTAGSELRDHMITYRMTDGGSFIGWMLFFDDQVPGGTDRDFNDLAVFVTVTPIPLPAAAWMGMGLLGTIGGAGAIRKRRLLA